ncbi:MAG TPA: oligosaccharide flippase family protein [Thermoplasmata archaeon]|nr:oligosaccharide flippase family protein [Thermoplasmata archaeon]
MAESIDGARSGLTSVTRGTLVMMIGTLGFVAESFVSRVILVRTLLPDQWSEFSLALALGGLVSAVGALGLGPAVARSLPFETSESERRRIVHTAYWVGGPSAVIVAAGLALFSLVVSTFFGAPLLGVTLLFFSVGVGISVFAGILASIFQGFEDVVPNAFYTQVLNPLLFIVFLVTAEIVAPRGDTYLGVLVAYAVAAVLSFLALVAYARRRLPRRLPSGPREPGLSGKLLMFAAPLFVVGVLSFITNNGDTLILGAFHSSDVGFYTADLSLARLLQVGIGSLAYIFLPVTARLVRSGDRGAVRITYATATKWMVLTSLPLFLVFSFFPNPSLHFVYGSGFPSSAVPLDLLVAGAFLSTLVGPSTMAQVAYGQTRLLFYNTAACAGVDLLVGLALIPTYGITGAAIAWACANAAYPALSMVQIAVLQGVHPFERHYVIPVALTAVPVGLLFAVVPLAPAFWLLPTLALAIGVLFLGVVLLSGSIDAGDRLLLEAVERLLGRRLPFVRSLAGFSRWVSQRGSG